MLSLRLGHMLLKENKLKPLKITEKQYLADAQKFTLMH